MKAFFIIGILLGSTLTALAGPYPACTSQAECNPSNKEICTNIFSNDLGTYCINEDLAKISMGGENPDKASKSNGSTPCITSNQPTTARTQSGWATREQLAAENAAGIKYPPAVRGFSAPSTQLSAPTPINRAFNFISSLWSGIRAPSQEDIVRIQKMNDAACGGPGTNSPLPQGCPCNAPNIYNPRRGECVRVVN